MFSGRSAHAIKILVSYIAVACTAVEKYGTSCLCCVGLVLLPLVGLLSGGGWLDISLKYLGRSRIPWIPHALIDFLLLSQIRIFVSIRAIDAFVDV